MKNDGRFKKGEHRSPATEFKKGQHWRPHAVFREKEYLRREYVEKQRPAGDIGAEHGVTEAAILFWLKKHNIPRRSMTEIRSRKKWGQAGSKNGMYGRRGENNPNWKGGCTPERQDFYSSEEWKRVARLVKKRDGRTCQRCGASGPDAKLEIHHIVRFAVVKLRAEPTNLVMLCDPCHVFVHSRNNTKKEFIRGYRGRG